jgi:hypothetical protein
MRRVTTARLLTLAAELRPRERQVVETVERLRLMSHAQLATLLSDPTSEASPVSAARSVRRLLAHLTELGVLARLARRVGGVRAGSAGHVYYLGPVGQRLIAYWQGHGLVRGRFRPEPGGRYVRHRLAVSELYVQLREASRDGLVDLLGFEAEPECWRPFTTGFGGQILLKPDGFIRVGLGAYEDLWFIEVDLGTESRSVIANKLRAYLQYFQSGTEQERHGVFPRVLLLTNTDARRTALIDVCSHLPAEAWALFTVGRLEQALEIVGGQIDEAVRHAPSREVPE